MIVVLIVLVAVVVAAFTAFWVWTRRMESEVDYTQLHNEETDERLRHTAQLGIGLSTSQGGTSLTN